MNEAMQKAENELFALFSKYGMNPYSFYGAGAGVRLGIHEDGLAVAKINEITHRFVPIEEAFYLCFPHLRVLEIIRKKGNNDE